MKKMTLILASLMMAALSANAQISKVLLQHEGNVTMFEPEDIQKAIDAAQNGDSIFLNKGTFPGFTITKQISVIGAGESNTRVSSQIIIDIPNKPTLSARMLDGIGRSSGGGTVIVNKAVNNLIIRKCSLYRFEFNDFVDDVSIDRCTVSRIMLSEKVIGLTINNSILEFIYGTANKDTSVKCINCHLTTAPPTQSSSSTVVTFVNCIVYNAATYHYSNKCQYLNCSVHSMLWGIYNDECNVDYSKIKDYTANELDFYKYYGTDGTIIGIEGGQSPYTLVTTAPKVTEKDIQVSTDMKKLNVNIKVTPN